ncbi:MAG: hypothetical protein SFY66_19565 [Oculatellaceae cyanobacterium bins.114]|nr:hypothetical protein [Oculatellaceae cyanobacterium bins.114]
MAIITREKHLIDTFVNLQCLLIEHGMAERSGRNLLILDERVTQWAIAALSRNPNYSIESILTALQERPPERHWVYFQTRLPEEALRALERKLSQAQRPEKPMEVPSETT